MKYALLFCLLFSVTAFALDPGSKAADFALNNTDGKTVKLSDYHGKDVVVIFVATRCPYSNAFNNVMEQLAKDYAAKGISFVGINSNKTESLEEVAQHTQEHFTFPVLKDPDNKIANLYEAQVTPEAFVIDSTGVIRYHGALGSSDNPTTNPAKANSTEIRAALDQLLAGKPIATAKTKAFGCSIKRVS